jgi:coenzyme F420-dependent glucose-6-phosphate dehydrogenase
MAAAAERTRQVKVGCGVTCPLFHYHPANVAHSFATLASLYPGRIWLGVGTGEALNETPFIEPPGIFPARWKMRSEMLVEAIELIRKYWNSQDYFSFNGKYFKLGNAFCYDKPTLPVPIYFSAYGPKAAFLAGQYGDHLITGFSENFQRIISEFEKGARKAGKDPARMEKMVYRDFAYGKRDETVKRMKQTCTWFLMSNYYEPDPRKAEANLVNLSDEMIEQTALIAENADDIIDSLNSYRKIGVEHVALSDSSIDPEKTIRVLKEHVIPHL